MALPPPIIEWEAHEFEHQHKSSDWYWGLGVIAVVLAAAAIIFNNVILGIAIIIAALLLALFAMTHHDPSKFGLNHRGIYVDEDFYPFQTLESFWVEHGDKDRASRLLIKSQKIFMPLLVISLDGVDEEEIEDFVSQYLPPDEHTEPIAHKLFEKLGF